MIYSKKQINLVLFQKIMKLSFSDTMSLLQVNFANFFVKINLSMFSYLKKGIPTLTRKK